MKNTQASMKIRPIESDMPVMEKYVEKLRQLKSNGRAYFARYEVAGEHDFRWLDHLTSMGKLDFCQCFLTHPDLQAIAPELVDSARFDESVRFARMYSLILDGELAFDLIWAGAYSIYRGTYREAKNMGGQVCDELFGDRFDEITVFRCGNAWSSWFYDVAWDSTYILIGQAAWSCLSTLFD